MQIKLKNVCFAFYTAGFYEKQITTKLPNQRFEEEAGHLVNIIMKILCTKMNLVDFICHTVGEIIYNNNNVAGPLWLIITLDYNFFFSNVYYEFQAYS